MIEDVATPALSSDRTGSSRPFRFSPPLRAISRAVWLRLLSSAARRLRELLDTDGRSQPAMASFYAFAAPILPGQVEARKSLFNEINTTGKKEYRASRKKPGVTKEQAWLQHTPMGDFGLRRGQAGGEDAPEVQQIEGSVRQVVLEANRRDPRLEGAAAERASRRHPVTPDGLAFLVARSAHR